MCTVLGGHNQLKNLIGIKKFKICQKVTNKLEVMNMKAFGVATFDKIVEKLLNK